jgi:hypothetical protein
MGPSVLAQICLQAQTNHSIGGHRFVSDESKTKGQNKDEKSRSHRRQEGDVKGFRCNLLEFSFPFFSCSPFCALKVNRS